MRRIDTPKYWGPDRLGAFKLASVFHVSGQLASRKTPQGGAITSSQFMTNGSYCVKGLMVKAATPKMDKNGYFSYVSSTAKKKKISLMQPRPPRMAFEEKRRPGVAERVDSSAVNAGEHRRVEAMSHRVLTDAPRARLFTQLESYQPRYHTIRENSDRKVESECKRRRNEQRKGHQSTVR
ncbi:unnamed protein product [Pieris macdunnoughi]|uniref:Uncharacterized protein n=1 Tax=Pieris macdunnoughi TaxID=345717 RepID=A0A821RYH8_9NEOP|nr:unnamed protein product [Pieris macdunnoughi]